MVPGNHSWVFGTVWEAPDQVRLLEEEERVQLEQENTPVDGLDRRKAE